MKYYQFIQYPSTIESYQSLIKRLEEIINLFLNNSLEHRLETWLNDFFGQRLNFWLDLRERTSIFFFSRTGICVFDSSFPSSISVWANWAPRGPLAHLCIRTGIRISEAETHQCSQNEDHNCPLHFSLMFLVGDFSEEWL